MKKKDSFVLRMPVVRYNPELDKYSNMVLFPEKVAKANAFLARVGLPDEFKETSTKNPVKRKYSTSENRVGWVREPKAKYVKAKKRKPGNRKKVK